MEPIPEGTVVVATQDGKPLLGRVLTLLDREYTSYTEDLYLVEHPGDYVEYYYRRNIRTKLTRLEQLKAVVYL